jgi:hypothetical protein
VEIVWLRKDFTHPERVDLPTGRHMRSIREADVLRRLVVGSQHRWARPSGASSGVARALPGTRGHGGAAKRSLMYGPRTRRGADAMTTRRTQNPPLTVGPLERIGERRIADAAARRARVFVREHRVVLALLAVGAALRLVTYFAYQPALI